MILDMVRTTAATTLFATLVLAGCQRGPTTSPEDAEVDPSGAVAEVAEVQNEDEPESPAEVSDEDESLEDASLASAEPGAEVITFDEMDANPGGTDIITVQPDRTKSGSLLTPDVLAGPK